MATSVNHGRRALLRGRIREAPPLRPPWSLPEEAFTGGCTRCDACLAACPENILVAGPGGFPAVDFRRGECTFCRACAGACPEPLFLEAEQTPWQTGARVSDACLARQGIVCQSCRDACPAAAVRFRPALGGVSVPQVDTGACTGCGACVGACPANAINVRPYPER